MLLTSPFKAAFALLIVSSSLQAADVKLPQDTIDKINSDFLDSYHINLECNKGVASPQIKLFAKNERLYMLRDSNSSIGTYVAELREIESNEYYHEEGMRFREANIANTSDFFISSETLKKGEGELTVILYRDIYKCDAKLNSWSVQRAIQDVQDEKESLLNIEKLKGEYMGLIEQAVHNSVITALTTPEGLRQDERAIYKLEINKSDGKIASVTSIELSQSAGFNAAALTAIHSLQSLQDIEFDEIAVKNFKERTIAADLSSSDILGEDSGNFVLYIELNAKRRFVSVAEEFRR